MRKRIGLPVDVLDRVKAVAAESQFAKAPQISELAVLAVMAAAMPM